MKLTMCIRIMVMFCLLSGLRVNAASVDATVTMNITQSSVFTHILTSASWTGERLVPHTIIAFGNVKSNGIQLSHVRLAWNRRINPEYPGVSADVRARTATLKRTDGAEGDCTEIEFVPVTYSVETTEGDQVDYFLIHTGVTGLAYVVRTSDLISTLKAGEYRLAILADIVAV